MSPSLELNFVVVQFKACITLFKFIKKCVKINFKLLIKGIHNHLGEQVNILIHGKDMQKKYKYKWAKKLVVAHMGTCT